MPPFIAADELRRLSGDGAAVADLADAYIRNLLLQLDTVRAEADATSIAAEQSAALLDQRYASITADLSRLQDENAQLSSAAEHRLAELADSQAERHQTHLKAMAKDGEIERLSVESAELHKSKRQLLELIEHKDAEIKEKNATIQSYLDKIVTLTDTATLKDAALHEVEAQLRRCHAACSRSTQEKELLEKHNSWLNEELTTKVNSFGELRRKHMELEADMSVKLDELDRQVKESSRALQRSKERAGELDTRVVSLEEDMRSSMATSASSEEQFTVELSTLTKLVELYKKSTEEWSKKAGELEGVIKALETHLNQVENDYKAKLDNSISARNGLEREATYLKQKLGKYETEIEKARKTNELSVVPISGFHAESNLEALSGESGSDTNLLENIDMPVHKATLAISAAALATSLLQDGWSLAKIYEKYQETADALQHEKWGRKHSEAMLDRVLHEIEQKAGLVLDDRAEHERVVEAYSLLEQKLQQALAEHDNFQNSIRTLMAETKRRERDCNIAQKEIDDLQNQVTILLKECQDIQLRCGAGSQTRAGSSNLSASSGDGGACLDPESVVSKHLTFKDINGLVEQNVKLRSLVRNLTCEEEKRDAEQREKLKLELQRASDEAAAKVEAVLKRSEEQGHMIESLHCSVTMYKRLYEEERQSHPSSHINGETLPRDGKELMRLFDDSQDISNKSNEKLAESARNLEQDLDTLRSELLSLRVERDKFLLEANFSREHLDSFKKEFGILREEANAVSARNVELSYLIVDYQKKLRENSNTYEASLESSHQLSTEVSFLKHEKEILVQAEKCASDEVRSLSERVHRLQSTLDTIQSGDEIRENARKAERRTDEESLKRAEREWAEAKKELQEVRGHVRTLTLDREKAIENSAKQVEEIRKELADAWHAVASAESRAAVAEARFSDLESKFNLTNNKDVGKDADGDHSRFSTTEDTGNLCKLKEEIDRLKEQSNANKVYMLQYKSIAQTNEVALKQIESAYEEYKTEAENLKKSLEDEILSLRNRVSELESNCILNSEDAASAIEAKERALSSASVESSRLRDEIAARMAQLGAMEVQVSSLKGDLEKEHIHWRTTQDNYERQVILQSETIQELTNTSWEVSSLQHDLVKQRHLSEELKTENDLVKTSWKQEKLQLQELKVDAERKYIEIDEQNKILHSRLELLHTRLADRKQYSAGISSENSDSKLESGLQNAVSYPRRSKEFAETEISLLKKEKSQLQSQLENALRTSEMTEASLRSQRQNSKATLSKDEEFKALQFQVKEICLLRESNIQLREENKHNFEECQKYREEAQTANGEAQKINTLLKEKQIELDASAKENEMRKMEIEHLEKRTVDLLENSEGIDADEHEKMKNELQQNKVLLSEKQKEIQQTRTQISNNQHQILELEQALTKSQLELTEREKAMGLQVEEAKKKLAAVIKRTESLQKIKDDLNKENNTLLKQIDDIKSRSIGGSPSDREKEKDTRIQTLERALEMERLKLKLSPRNLDAPAGNTKDREKVDDELAKHNHSVDTAVQSSMLTPSELSSVPFEDQASAYSQSMINPVNDGSGNPPSHVASFDADTSVAVAGHQVPFKQIRPPNLMVIDDTEKVATAHKPNTETCKGVRKLVRILLEQPGEPAAETEMSAVEGLTISEGNATTHEPEHGDNISVPQPIPVRKRHATSPVSEKRKDPFAQVGADDSVLPLYKKSKDTKFGQDGSEEQAFPSTSENLATVQQLRLPSFDNFDAQPAIEVLETTYASASTMVEVCDVADEDNTSFKNEVDDQLKGATDNLNQDDFQYEGDVMLEDILDNKPSAAVEFLDEPLKDEDGAENPQSSIEGDDEKEEGELMQDESEQKQDGVSGEGQHEADAGDKIGIPGKTGDVVEPFSLDVLSERKYLIEEPSEGPGRINNIKSNDQAVTFLPSSRASSSSREGSPSSTVSEHQSFTTVAEKNESQGGRTINLRPRVSEARHVRGARSSLFTRGRGRASYIYRRGDNRGRGGRGTRGTGFKDRE